MMVVYDSMNAKKRNILSEGFYAEFDESNSDTSATECHIKKRKMCKTCKMPMLGHKKRYCTKRGSGQRQRSQSLFLTNCNS